MPWFFEELSLYFTLIIFREQRENYGFIPVVPREKKVQRKRRRNAEMKTVPSNIFKERNFKPQLMHIQVLKWSFKFPKRTARPK